MGLRIYFIMIFTLLIAVIFMACNEKGDCLKTTGKIIVEERNQDLFHGITLDDDINLLLVPDTIQKVFIEGGENLLPEISSEVDEQMLYLQNNNICKYVRSYQKEILTEIHFANLKILVHIGSARIRSVKTITCDNFLIWLDGARGEIDLDLKIIDLTIEHLSGNGSTCLRGDAENCNINSTSQGLLDLRNLKISNLKIVADSYNDAYIWVTDTLDILISNLGSVYYKGDPFLKRYERTSTGKLIKMN